ncbi:phage/plasmid replication protein, II/X family [Methylovulum psychrotolerans]|uniref:Alpha/beta hydrolase n=1 Tax=Methylovulum psychrotolerans TaxID=1704499 RepID=A0A2S5CFP9_9GAMM|nr:phage/plasmid replication protein, II/X family [Methylovulum psychrotolerans]POZ49630.1 alpha/beta hydrolase [Methylovulum psychrotolerans]
MIDWITAIVPFRHSSLLHDGQVFSISRSGEIEWTTNKRLKVLGSYDSSLHVQSDLRSRSPEGDYLNIVFDGNPVKFFQGHNLWGTNDLVGLMAETVLKISDILHLPISPDDWNLIIGGFYYLKRVDSTMMIELGNNANVESFLYSAERLAHMRYKGQGIMTKGTLYFGKHSRRESLKLYNKLKEILAKGHELPLELQLPEIYKWVESKLRAEATTRSLELKQRSLDLAAVWCENKPEEVLLRLLSGLDMSENHTITETALQGLPPRLVAVYHLWREGHDLRAMYPRMTFYRYRKQLQENAGIDIAIKQGNRQQPAPNVVDFRRVLVPERCQQVPSWAIGTPLYFEPRIKISA